MIDPSSIGLYTSGTTVGGIPGHGNYAPNQTEAVMAALRAQSDSKMTAYLLQNDKRAQYAAHTIANTVAGSNGNQYMNEHGRAIAMASGMAINSSLMAGIAGGNILDMYGGINSGFAAGGVGMMTRNGGNLSTHSGAGYVNDQMSRLATLSIQENFFNSRGGSIYGRTHGLNRSELGSVAQYIGMGGAYAGDKKGDLIEFKDDAGRIEAIRKLESKKDRTWTDDMAIKELKSLEGKVGPEGGAVFNMDQNYADKMNKLTQAGAKAMSNLKDVFGALNDGELWAAAKELTSMDISTMSGSKEISARMDRIKVFAKANGMSAAAVAQEQINISQALQSSGIMGTTAAAMSEYLQQSTQIAVNGSNETRNASGGHTRQFSRAQVNALGSMGAAASLLESPEIIAARYAMDEMGIDKDGKSSIRSAMNDLKNVKGSTSSERTANRIEARRRLEEVINQATGASSSQIIQSVGGVQAVMDSMGAAAGRELAQYGADEDQERLKINARQILAKNMGYKDNASSNFVADAFTSLSANSMKEMTDKLKLKDKKGAKDVINNADLSDEQKANLLKGLDGAGDGLEKALDRVGVLSDNEVLSNLKRDEDTNRSESRELADWANQSIYGGGKVGRQGILDSLVDGMLGAKNMDPNRAMALLKADGSKDIASLGKDNDAGGKTVDDNAVRVLTGLDVESKVLDPKTGKMVERSAEEKARIKKEIEHFKKNVSTKDGWLKFVKEVKSKGDYVGMGADGETYFGTSSAIEVAKEELNKQAELNVYGKIFGDDVSRDSNGDIKVDDEWFGDGTDVNVKGAGMLDDLADDADGTKWGVMTYGVDDRYELMKTEEGKKVLALHKADKEKFALATQAKIEEYEKSGDAAGADSLRKQLAVVEELNADKPAEDTMIELLKEIANNTKEK